MNKTLPNRNTKIFVIIMLLINLLFTCLLVNQFMPIGGIHIDKKVKQQERERAERQRQGR